MAQGFGGVVDSWVTSIITGLDEGANGIGLEHPLVKRLVPELLDEMAELESTIAELDGTIQAATAVSGDDESDDDAADDENALSEVELRDLRRRLNAARRELRALNADFAERLQVARGALSADEEVATVLDVLRGDIVSEMQRRVAERHQQIVAALENWWSKYRVPLFEIESERDDARARLEGFLEALGYDA